MLATTLLLLSSTTCRVQADEPPIPTAPPSTWSPTVTPSPTITAFPTVTAFPTHQLCNVCGRDGTVMTRSDEVLTLPVANITCGDADTAGFRGEIPGDTCDFLQLYIADNDQCGCEVPSGETLAPTMAPTDAFPACNICGDNGDGTVVANNRSGELTLGNETLQCGFVAQAGEEALWSPDVCDFWQNVSYTVCGCGPPEEPAVDGSEDNDGDNGDEDEEVSECYLCGGPDFEFVHPDADVPVPFEFTALFLQILDDGIADPFKCSNLEQVQDVALWSPLVCAFLQQEGAPVCGCRAVPVASPVQAPDLPPDGPAETAASPFSAPRAPPTAIRLPGASAAATSSSLLSVVVVLTTAVWMTMTMM